MALLQDTCISKDSQRSIMEHNLWSMASYQLSRYLHLSTLVREATLRYDPASLLVRQCFQVGERVRRPRTCGMSTQFWALYRTPSGDEHCSGWA